MSSSKFVGRSYDEFTDSLIGKAESTKKLYTKALAKFLDWADMDTEQLFQQHWDNTRSDDPRDSKIIPRKVTDYMRYLHEEQGKAPSTCDQVKKAVSKFFEANSVLFKVNGDAIKITYKGKERVTKEQIRTLIAATSNLRNQSIIMFLKDSGLRIGDLCHIQVKHVIDAIRLQKEFHTFSIRQEKTGLFADPVLGPECIQYLRMWWNARTQYGCSEDPEAFVYCSLENKPDITTKKGIKRKGTKIGDQVKSGTLSSVFDRLVKKTGLNKENISAHSLRKYHQTQCQAGGIPDTWINVMTGRKTSGSVRAYVKPDSDQLLSFYIEAYDKLAISSDTSRKELEIVKLQNAELMEKYRELEDQFDKISIPFHDMVEIMRQQYLTVTPEEEIPDFMKNKYIIEDEIINGKKRKVYYEISE